MVPSFDIFKIDLIRDVLWQDAAESLAAARVSVEKLAMSSPGEYLIFDQKTAQRVLVTLPGVCANPGSQAAIKSILKPVVATHGRPAERFRLDPRYPYKQPIGRTS